MTLKNMMVPGQLNGRCIRKKVDQVNIELSDKQVRITWPGYDATTEAEIINRLNSVPGIEGRGRRWYAPVIQTARLMELFPKASYDYAAIAKGDATASVFFDSMVHLGVEFAFDDAGAIRAVGEGVSPLIQQLIDERATALRLLVAESLAAPKPQRQPAGPVQGPYTVDDTKFEPLLKGMKNAAKKVEEDELKGFKYGKRRRKAKVKQGELGL